MSEMNHTLHLLQRKGIPMVMKNGDAVNGRLLVCPYLPHPPQDGVFTFTSVATVWDVREFTDPFTILMFDEREDLVLRLLADYPRVFGYEIVRVRGVPGDENPAWFSDAAFNAEYDDYTRMLADAERVEEVSEHLLRHHKDIASGDSLLDDEGDDDFEEV